MNLTDTNTVSETPIKPPNESLGRLFLRFLRLGLLAWGGAVAHVGQVKQEFVEDERWVTPQQFNRLLAVYQVLPGPEATELCIYFGMMARGRIGGLLAGLGFILPGFLFMLLLSWFYVTYGISSPLFAAIFFGFKPVVAALIVRAVHRIGEHALANRWLWMLAIAAGIATLLNVHFLIILLGAGLIYLLIKHPPAQNASPAALLIPFAVPTLIAAAAPSLIALFGYGLRAGLLTFGGAYTAIPIVQQDAVEVGGWLTHAQLLDGLALGGIVPAPLIMFVAFVGYLGGGLWGAVVITIGTFLPAFCFTLFGHGLFEHLIANKRVHTFLDGVTGSVVGLITVTAAGLLWAARPEGVFEIALSAVIFIASLVIVYRWKSKVSVLAAIVVGGLLGLLTLI